MTSVPLTLTGLIEINDGFLTAMIAVCMLMLLVMGPLRNDFVRTLFFMFRFKSPESEITYPQYSSFGFVALFVLSSFSMGVPLSYCYHGALTGSALLNLLLISGMTAVVSYIWLLLYLAVNTILYNSQTVMVRPTRWSNFFATVYAAQSFILLAFSVIVIFLDIPLLVLVIFAIVLTIIMAIGRIFRVLTALFRNKRFNVGIILYLCALEIIPTVLMAVIWSRLIN